MNQQTEVFISLPKMEDLLCVNCQINPTGANSPIIKSFFHYQVLTCRLIIKTVSQCIASPDPKIRDSINVIVSQNFYKAGKLQEVLLQLGAKCSPPVPVNPRIYVESLTYTFKFKFSPHWNSAGKLSLRGPDFLTQKHGIEAVEWKILIEGDNSKLVMKPAKINVFPLSVRRLPIPEEDINKFLTNPKIMTLNLTRYGNMYASVLPSMKRGRLMTVSKTRPMSCPFNSYDDLRSHWKNMYGYRLPKTDADMLYYELNFPPFNSEHFIYPGLCLRSKGPEFITCNPDEIVSRFVQDFKDFVQSICETTVGIGQVFPLLNMNDYKNVRLHTPNQRIFNRPEQANFSGFSYKDSSLLRLLTSSTYKNQLLSMQKMGPKFNEDDGQILSFHDVDTQQPNNQRSEVVRTKPLIKDVKNVRFDLSRNIQISPPQTDSHKINFKALELTNNSAYFASITPTLQVQSWKNPASIAQKLKHSIDVKNSNCLPRIDSLTTGETSGVQRIEKRSRHHLMPWSRTTHDLQKYQEQRHSFKRSQSLIVEPKLNRSSLNS